MCFSPEADFVAAAVVGTIGVTTLRLVQTRREVIIGVLPLLFAAHQFTEAFVWLGLQGSVPAWIESLATTIYATFAYVLLPILVPLGFLLLEPVEQRRQWLVPLAALGAAVGLIFLWQLTQYPIDPVAHPRGIAYVWDAPHQWEIGFAYAAATCVPALLSSRRYLRWFGVVNVVAATAATTVYHDEFASIWCLYAAMASLLVCEHFRRQRAHERRVARRPHVAAARA